MDLLYLRPHVKWDCVREIIINRPEKRNAFTLEMWSMLTDLIEECNQDETVRILVIKGADNTAFAAGADISEFPSRRATLDQAREHKSITDCATKALQNARPITVSVISGFCFGGGMQLASVCDMRIADESAVFAVTPIRLGFVYGLDETNALIQLVGFARAKELLYTGKQISAQQALEYGFLQELFKNGDSQTVDHFHGFVDSHLESLLKVAPKAQQAMKRVFSLLEQYGLSEVAKKGAETLEDEAFAGKEYQEGIKSFLEKRKPSYWET